VAEEPQFHLVIEDDEPQDLEGAPGVGPFLGHEGIGGYKPLAVSRGGLDASEDLVGAAEEPIRGDEPVDPHVGALEVEASGEPIEGLSGVVDRVEFDHLPEFSLEGLDQAFDLASALGMVGGRDVVVDDLCFEELLEGGGVSPGEKRSAAVCVDGLRLSVTVDSLLEDLDGLVSRGLFEQAMAYDEPGEVVLDEQHRDSLGTDAKLGEVELPDGVSARGFPPVGMLLALGSRASVNELVAGLGEHPGDGAGG